MKNRRKKVLIMYSPGLEQKMVELHIYIYWMSFLFYRGGHNDIDVSYLGIIIVFINYLKDITSDKKYAHKIEKI